MPREAVAILIAGFVSLFLKGFFIEFLAGKTLPPIVKLALGHVPTAVLAALATPLFFNDEFAIQENWLAFLLATVTVLLALKTRNLLISIGIPFSLLLLYYYY